LAFTAGEIMAGEYHFAVGTAGSATLVLQTILLPLATASAPSHLTLEGGTHNPYAPPFDFLQKAFLPIINRMGPEVSATLERAGFYPAGGGRFEVAIKPAAKLSPLTLMEKGALISKTGRAIICSLPRHIAERELRVIAEKMSLLPEQLHLEEIERGPGLGNIVLVELAYENITEVFTGFGDVNVRAEAVAANVVKEAQEYLAADVPVGAHLADQLLLPLACAEGGTFVTLPLTRHAGTNIAIIQQFLAVDIATEKLSGKQRLIKITRRA
jgi:RNA 3'-terminal phosphate cyclase (ATP)